MSIDTSAPVNAESLGWSETTPHDVTTITASWTKSTSGDLASQEVEYFINSDCSTSTTTIHSPVAGITDSFTGNDGSTYYYLVRSTDNAGNINTSAFSEAMAIDTSAPIAATAMAWVETSPHDNTVVTSEWTVSASSDVASQTASYWTNAACDDSEVGSSTVGAAATQNSFTGSDATTYYYKIITTDTAGNTTPSACSVVMAIDTTAPDAPTAMAWSEITPHDNIAITATWAESGSGDIASQRVHYFVDGTCGAVDSDNSIGTGTGSDNFSGVDASTYSFTVTAIDSAGNEKTSTCSVAMAIDTTAPLKGTSLYSLSPSVYANKSPRIEIRHIEKQFG